MAVRTFVFSEAYFRDLAGGGDFATEDGKSDPHTMNDRGQGPWKVPGDAKIVSVGIIDKPPVGKKAVCVTLESKKWKGEPATVLCLAKADGGTEAAKYRAAKLAAKRKTKTKK